MVVRIRLDPSAREPLSEQLRAALASRIASGRIPAGGRLPTVRELAASMGLAPNTVARAYRDLAAGGLIVGLGRRGTFVTERLPVPPAERDVHLARAAAAYARRARQLGFGAPAARAAVDRALRVPDR